MSHPQASASANSNAAKVGEAAREFLTFTLGAEEYGVDILKVQEIRGYDTVTRIPDTPAFIKGVINLRGQVMPVIDLSARLGKGVAEDGPRQVIIVIESGDDVAGLLVDAVCDSFIVDADQINPPPSMGEENSPLVSAVITSDTGMTVLLSVSHIIPERASAAAASAASAAAIAA